MTKKFPRLTESTAWPSQFWIDWDRFLYPFKHSIIDSSIAGVQHNFVSSSLTPVCLSWILLGWRPFERKTNQPLFWALCYIIKSRRLTFSFSCSTFSFSLSPPWKRAKCSLRQSKISKIFPGKHAPGPPYNCASSLPTRTPPPPPPPRKIQAARLHSTWHDTPARCDITRHESTRHR